MKGNAARCIALPAFSGRGVISSNVARLKVGAKCLPYPGNALCCPGYGR